MVTHKRKQEGEREGMRDREREMILWLLLLLWVINSDPGVLYPLLVSKKL